LKKKWKNPKHFFMPHSARKLLLDVSLACREIMEFTEDKSYEDFQEDCLLQLAIE
jgi:uncharacterized protein with HEPN domain